MGRRFPLGGEDLPAKAMLQAAREVSRWLDTLEFRYNEEQNDQLNTNKDGNFAVQKGKACNFMCSLLRRHSLEVSSAGSLFQGWGAEASRADTEYFLFSTYMAEINTRKKRSRRDVHHG